MSIKHSFTSGKADGGDATLIRPSDWNADHTGGLALGTATPLIESGIGAAGTAAAGSHEDHVHPGAFAAGTPALTFGTSASGAATTAIATDATIRLPEFSPADHNFLAWTCDPVYALATTTALATAGTLYTTKIILPVATSITNIIVYVSVVGATLTSGQCFSALYQGVAGVLLGVTADQSTPWVSTGTKTMALAGGAVAAAAGTLVIASWFNGTTGPAFYRNGTLSGVFPNVGLATAQSRFGLADTSITTTAPDPLGTISGGSSISSIWYALS